MRARELHPAVGWVVITAGNHLHTVRWRRGDPVAYVLDGRQTGEHGSAAVQDTIAVPAQGWTDLTEIRQRGETWHREQRAARSTRAR